MLASSSLLASSRAYDLQIKHSINGHESVTSHMIVLEGNIGLMTYESDHQKKFIEVIPTESLAKNNRGIQLTFVMGSIGVDGKRTIESRPRIITQENREASLTKTENNGKEALFLSVLPQRIEQMQ